MLPWSMPRSRSSEGKRTGPSAEALRVEWTLAVAVAERGAFKIEDVEACEAAGITA
jgi:hypothetical protein